MKIYLIPCPIAENTSSDVLSPQILAALQQTTHFLVENVRTARRFISELKLGIQIDELIFEVLDKDTDAKTVQNFYEKHSSVDFIGVISEAGCPGVADPGALAVSIAQQQNIEVIPLVGPSSILLGLMGSGFSGQSFAFIGYLPIDKAARIRKIEQLDRDVAKWGQTQIFIETPYRNNALLEDLIAQCAPDSLICIACEVTAPDGFVQTKKACDWAKKQPDLHKKPCIFLLGK
ncbi:MAG: SAM-dependent methyltransferase [Cytophagales bacterium]|nr:SAM-dependent methyltransferase [Cytophagales bacterium]